MRPAESKDNVLEDVPATTPIDKGGCHLGPARPRDAGEPACHWMSAAAFREFRAKLEEEGWWGRNLGWELALLLPILTMVGGHWHLRRLVGAHSPNCSLTARCRGSRARW
jgi:hypothetical protein